MKHIKLYEGFLNESTPIKMIEDKENGRKFDFYKTPSGKIEYQIYDWDDVDGDWSKAGSPSDDIEWLFAEENPDIDAFLKTQNINKKD